MDLFVDNTAYQHFSGARLIFTLAALQASDSLCDQMSKQGPGLPLTASSNTKQPLICFSSFVRSAEPEARRVGAHSAAMRKKMSAPQKNVPQVTAISNAQQSCAP